MSTKQRERKGMRERMKNNWRRKRSRPRERREQKKKGKGKEEWGRE
jgi:hypothetical protein